MAQDRRRRVGLRRSRHAVRHDDQRLAPCVNTRTGSTRRTRAPSTCSSTTRPATWRRSTCMKFFNADDGDVRRRGVPPRLRRRHHRAGDHRRQLRPTRRRAIARELPQVPPARPRLRQPRRAADGARRCRTTPTRAAPTRPRSRRSCAARRTSQSAKIAGGARALRRLRSPTRAVPRRHRQAPRRGVRGAVDQAASRPSSCKAAEGGRGTRRSSSARSTATERPDHGARARPARSAS